MGTRLFVIQPALAGGFEGLRCWRLGEGSGRDAIPKGSS